MRLVVGLAGRMGSGKGSVSDYLHGEYGASQYRFSGILMDILERLHLALERVSLQKLGVALRRDYGEDVIVKALKKDLDGDEAEIGVIDGIRYENEVDMLRGFEDSILIFLTAPARTRYERCIKRTEKAESGMSFEDFMEAEGRETERYIDEIGEKAEHVVENTGSLEELFEKVDTVMAGKGVKKG